MIKSGDSDKIVIVIAMVGDLRQTTNLHTKKRRKKLNGSSAQNLRGLGIASLRRHSTTINYQLYSFNDDNHDNYD